MSAKDTHDKTFSYAGTTRIRSKGIFSAQSIKGTPRPKCAAKVIIFRITRKSLQEN